MQIEDQIPSARVSAWHYQCVVRCPHTGERLTSDEVCVPVSALRTQELSLPVFKMALVVCQDEYESEEDFARLNAPRFDGKRLVAKLEEMHFKVL